jgi:hypothetical protein
LTSIDISGNPSGLSVDLRDCKAAIKTVCHTAAGAKEYVYIDSDFDWVGRGTVFTNT